MSGGGGGVRVDVNQMIEVFVKNSKKMRGVSGVGVGARGRVGGGGSGWM